MGRSFESVRMGAEEISARWLNANRATKERGPDLWPAAVRDVKKHSSEAFYALDDPLAAAIFSVLIE